MNLRRIVEIIALLIVSCAVKAQDNPAPLPPNYELIRKATGRWCGEYNYKRLKKRFERCDTTMTVDHFRCLYYGAWLRRGRGNVEYKVSNCRNYYDLYCAYDGVSSPEANKAWWRYQMLLTAVWSSGNGTEEHPFYVTCYEDLYFMIYDLGLHWKTINLGVGAGNPIACPTEEGVTVYVVIGAPQR